MSAALIVARGRMLKSIVVGVALLAGALLPSHAAPLYSYTSGVGVGDSADAANGTGPLYASFSTGDKALNSVSIDLLLSRDDLPGNDGRYYVAIFETPPPGTLASSLIFASFDDDTLPSDPTLKNFSFAISLKAKTQYWVGVGGEGLEGFTELVWYFLPAPPSPSDPLVLGESWYASGLASSGIRSNIDGAYQMEITGTEVPLPAALPLFATILAGGGLIAWRRKRKLAAVASS